MIGARTYCETPFLHSFVVVPLPVVPVVPVVPADVPFDAPAFVLVHGVVSLIVFIAKKSNVRIDLDPIVVK